jgi:hypothetical protein
MNKLITRKNYARDVMREYILQKVIPAIIDKWPDEDEGRTIWIQQDNAKPHILPNDTEFQGSCRD